MVRISAIFIAVCMVLIAVSLGVVVYLRFGFTGVEAAVVGLGVLTALAVYNAMAARMRDRAEASAQISALSRSSGDLARQLAEFGLRLNAMDRKVEQVLERSLSAAQPLAAELEELSTLVKQLADSVAAHELSLNAAAKSRAEPLAVAATARAGRSRRACAAGRACESSRRFTCFCACFCDRSCQRGHPARCCAPRGAGRTHDCRVQRA
jgi:cyclic-di-GMP phosphodiesterase, flagellum assembly factor TipF